MIVSVPPDSAIVGLVWLRETLGGGSTLVNVAMTCWGGLNIPFVTPMMAGGDRGGTGSYELSSTPVRVATPLSCKDGIEIVLPEVVYCFPLVAEPPKPRLTVVVSSDCSFCVAMTVATPPFSGTVELAMVSVTTGGSRPSVSWRVTEVVPPGVTPVALAMLAMIV